MRADATARELVDPRTGASFPFDAGAHCLDFAHSGGEGPYAVFDPAGQLIAIVSERAGRARAEIVLAPA